MTTKFTDDEIDRILSITDADDGSALHATSAGGDALFTWDYHQGARPALARLYEKAKRSQWNANDLPWHIDVDQEKRAVEGMTGMREMLGTVDVADTPVAKWGDAEWLKFSIESENWMLSQFLHGEQGALLCTAKIVETVPWLDAKYYASTQVMDEARHVEVFARYLDDKLSGHYPINAHLRMLIDDILGDNRWDLTYLGMQIMVEGLALAAFGMLRMFTTEPLILELLKYVMADEARHVAFGVLSLKDYYGELTAAEIHERQEFAYEAAVRMRDRLMQQEVWERIGVDVREAIRFMRRDPGQRLFQQMLFAKIVPNCKKLGLLDAGDGWLRTKFGELGVIQFEDWVDTGEEYEMLQAVGEQ